ncbi:HalD/BesD family halogenase [Pseudophaeobacter sp.]|uniref:HalD/BesD family halogenase n=1 Tax=Pseudophaeobacter sp. TaxID=1971739 RepID=UPI00405804B9
MAGKHTGGAPEFDLSDVVDLGRYPIDLPQSPAFERLLADLRRDLAEDGCAILPGFANAQGVAALVKEAEQLSCFAHLSTSRTNAYFSKDDPSLPFEHPVRQFYDRSNGFIPADRFGPNSPLRRLYEAAEFMPFIRAALEEPEHRFFRYDDPLADVIINMVEEGEGFPWHFDTNTYTVTLAIQNPEEGGIFEYAPNLRSARDENFGGVARVLAGQNPQVRSIDLQPGDLQIFRSRHSLHRVTAMRGARRRYVGIFSFVETKGMCGGVERTRQLYGRVLPRHHQRAGLRGDGLKD